MVTNYPQQLTATTHATSDKASPAGAGIVVRAMGRLGQLFCGLRGHDAVLHFEGNRVMMRCTSCGHDTPGWEISGRGPRRRYEGDARRHALATSRAPRLVLRKSA
jgi:NAD-dependent SIR2 family protein deacetylase